MSNIDDFLAELNDYEPMLFPTDLKEAIVGKMEFFSGSEGIIERILIDKEKCFEIFMERDGMTYEDAIEHFDYNVIGSYMDGVPAYATFIEWTDKKVEPKAHGCGGNCSCK